MPHPSSPQADASDGNQTTSFGDGCGGRDAALGSVCYPVAANVARHSVLFFSEEVTRCQAVASFVSDGLLLGHAAIVLMAQERQQDVLHLLALHGVDTSAHLAAGSLQVTDSYRALAEISRDDTLDAEAVAALVHRCLERARPDGSHEQVRIYDELVDVLQGNGSADAALRLEQVWAQLQEQFRFALLCGYSVEHFRGQPSERQRTREAHDGVGVGGLQVGGQQVGSLQVGSQQVGGAPLSQASIQERVAQVLDDVNVTSEPHTALVDRGESHLRTIADALPMLVCYIDSEQRYRFINRAYERWFSIDREAILGRSLREILGEEAYVRIADRVAGALAGSVQTFQERLAYARGPLRDVEASYYPHVGATGEVEGFVGLVSDIGDRRRMEAARAEALGRTARLMQITAALAEAVTPEQVFEAVIDQVVDTLSALSGGLYVVDEHEQVCLLHSVGYSQAAVDALRRIPLDSLPSVPALEVIRTGIPQWFESQEELLVTYPHLAPLIVPGRASQIACLPIFIQRKACGAVAFSFDVGRPLDLDQQNFLLLVARYSGQAVERLRLLEAERKSRAQAEAGALRAQILSRTSRVLAECGDNVTGALQVVAEQVAKEYCDLCSVCLLEGAKLEVVALNHRRPDSTVQLQALLEGGSLNAAHEVFERVASSRKSQALDSQRMREVLLALAPLDEAWVLRLTSGTTLAMPIGVRGDVIGVLFFIKEAGSGDFAPEDGPFFEELAERVAIGVESVRLYRAHEQARARTELLYGLAQTVIGASDRGQVFDAALDTLERAVGTRRSAILTFDRDSEMRFRAWRGLSEGYRAAVKGHSPWARHERNPEPIFVADVRRDASVAALLPLLRAESIGAVGFVPLVAGGELIGKFMIYYEAPRRLASHELDMVKAIANHVAVATSRFHAAAELLETVRFNDVFTGILGHDLRNPLGAIMTSAQLALRRADHERNQKPLTRILSSGTRMSRMIDQLLDFTRVRVGGGISVERKDVDLVPLLRQVMDELDDAYPEWSLRLEQTGVTRGYWDPDRLAQVFSNLIANALQHGEVEYGVTVRVDGTQVGLVRVSVENKGVVPEELLPHLFEPMTGGAHRRHKSQGLGLGLYISQQIVKGHGGRIDVASDVDGGTVLTVVLPAAVGLTGALS